MFAEYTMPEYISTQQVNFHCLNKHSLLVGYSSDKKMRFYHIGDTRNFTLDNCDYRECDKLIYEIDNKCGAMFSQKKHNISYERFKDQPEMPQIALNK